MTRGQSRSVRSAGSGNRSKKRDRDEKGAKAGEDEGEDEEEDDGVNEEYHVRMHRFLTGREQGGVKPVYGLTAYVLSLFRISVYWI